jgi:hypothetical protein
LWIAPGYGVSCALQVVPTVEAPEVFEYHVAPVVPSKRRYIEPFAAENVGTPTPE